MKQKNCKACIPLLITLFASVIITVTTLISPVFGNSGKVNAESATVAVWDGGTSEKFAGGDGGIDNPYRISGGAELSLFSGIINRTVTAYGGAVITDFALFNSPSVYYELTGDIYLNSTADWQNWATENTGLNDWIPIGSAANPFKGNFDGNGKTVSGVYIKYQAQDYQGLFGYLAGSVKNLTVKDSIISGRSYIGGIVGSVNDGEIDNCINAGNITGEQYTGGIAGQLLATGIIPTIKNCTNSGLITGVFVATSRSTMIGGIVGENNGVVDNCSNTGNLSLDSKGHCGGVAGQNSYQVINCYNTGSIAITQNAADRYGVCSRIGGVVGSNYAAGISQSGDIFIKNSFNTGAITGKANDVGGIAGYSGYDISDCFNSGDISISGAAASGLGGVIGAASSCSIKRCYNTGTVTDVSGVSFTGGLIGRLTYGAELMTSVDRCYNAGSVIKTGAIKKGSLIGYANGKVYVSVTDCYYDKSVSDVLGVVFFAGGTDIDTASDNEGNNVLGLTISEMTGENALSAMIFASPAEWSVNAPESTDNTYDIFYPQLAVFTSSENIAILSASKESAAIRYDYGDWEHIADSDPSKHIRECLIYTQTEECSFGDWEETTAPTCTIVGEETRTCFICGHEETRPAAATGHDAGAWITTLEPACTTTGTKELRCTVCGEVLDTGKIPALGHDYGDWVQTTAPTCTVAGEETRACTICGHEEMRPVAALEHILVKTDAVYATCTTAGNSTYWTCSVCGKHFSDVAGENEISNDSWVIPALGHSYGSDRESDASGHWHECDCGDKSSFAAHTESDWIIDVTATATTDGSKHKECTICGYVTQTEVIPATGGSINYDNEITGGANGSWTGGMESGYQITVNIEFSKFAGVKVDGVLISAEHYIVVSGSTVITLNADYLKTLTGGGHTVEIVFTDGGIASTTLTILADDRGNDGLSPGAIAGIVIGSVLLTALAGFAIFWFLIKKKKLTDLLAVFKKKT